MKLSDIIFTANRNLFRARLRTLLTVLAVFIGAFTLTLTNVFAFISLLAASFGIINTLVIAVMERVKEIGLQRAMGMGRGKVFLLFSIESILIGFWGAVLGVILAVIAGLSASYYLAKNYLDSFAGYQVIVFTPASVAFVISLICVVAFIAGVFP
ncbi:MAG: ABC transporter permease, partial [Blastocatellia bacterium]